MHGLKNCQNVTSTICVHGTQQYGDIASISKLEMVDIGRLCHPLWAFPVVGVVAQAKEFFRTMESKCSVEEWLMCKQQY